MDHMRGISLFDHNVEELNLYRFIFCYLTQQSNLPLNEKNMIYYR